MDMLINILQFNKLKVIFESRSQEMRTKNELPLL